jgi:hypothetical protein
MCSIAWCDRACSASKGLAKHLCCPLLLMLLLLVYSLATIFNSDAIKLHVSHFLTRTICPGTLPALWSGWLVFSHTQQQALQCLCQTPNVAGVLPSF